jgi:Ca2+-binding EF-hand superfamily protein
MPFPILFIPIIAAAAAAPSPAAITVVGNRWAPFISPMGEPFRSHSADDDTLGDWFRQADRNHDGVLTPNEMQADAERWFAKLDTNHDGQIDPDELVAYEWQVAPEIQLGSKQRRARGAPPLPPDPTDDDQDKDDQPQREHHPGGQEYGWGGHRDHDRYADYGPQGAARYALLNMPEPVAAADADFNRSISLDEFKQAALERFQLLDKTHQGRLGLEQLRAMLPPPPTPGKHPKHKDNEADTRVGSGLPPPGN